MRLPGQTQNPWKGARMKVPGFGALPDVAPDMPILIAGPTASGKSDLALHIAETQGGVVVNADASQVFDCWRVVTARPSQEDEARAPHALYGHIPWNADYSAGHWLREVTPLLEGGARPIITGGTGLYFMTLTVGMAQIPPVPPEVRAEGDGLTLETLLEGVDARTRAGIDTNNRARVQRAWEVQRATGRGLADWQADTPPPVLPITSCLPLVVQTETEWLNARIARRFDKMVEMGALDEVAAMLPYFDAARPAFRAIGVPELVAHLTGEATLDEARSRASIATRQFAKRQRTWFRSKMRHWHGISPIR